MFHKMSDGFKSVRPVTETCSCKLFRLSTQHRHHLGMISDNHLN